MSLKNVRSAAEFIDIIDADIRYAEGEIRRSRAIGHREKQLWSSIPSVLKDYSIDQAHPLHVHLVTFKEQLAKWCKNTFQFPLAHNTQNREDILANVHSTLKALRECLSLEKDLDNAVYKNINYQWEDVKCQLPHLIQNIDTEIYGKNTIDLQELNKHVYDPYSSIDGRVLREFIRGDIVGYYVTDIDDERFTITHAGILPPYHASGGREFLAADIMIHAKGRNDIPLEIEFKEKRQPQSTSGNVPEPRKGHN